MTRQLADILARDIIDDVADEICRDETLRRRVADRLRDELARLSTGCFPKFAWLTRMTRRTIRHPNPKPNPKEDWHEDR
jgi:hypothetical protein